MFWSFFDGLDYPRSMMIMHALRDRVQAGDLDGALMAIEYPPVITLGRSASPQDVLLSETNRQSGAVSVVRADRGGGVTVHGPGQLVIYPIVNLNKLHVRTRVFVQTLAELSIELLQELGIEGAAFDPDAPGVWIDGQKISSIGLHLQRGVTTHGISLNVRSMKDAFSWIVACHMPQMRVTSIIEQSGKLLSLKEVATRWIAAFSRRYRKTAHWLTPEDFVEKLTDQSVDNGVNLNH